ncbi:MAG: isoleucine--tRNA ligase [Clostridiales bacterium]|nr:isoleucine--tRNA ligase [Clostridiales bacterium]
MDFAGREKEIIEFWEERGIFAKSIEAREGAPVFTFYDGPPTANGKPHIGHVITRAFKDAIPRYKTMKGFKVLRKAGWDTHGLPVEREVEKQLGINGKQDIEKYGVEPFIKKCKESVWKYEEEWKDMSRRVGFWADMENPYVTFHNNYIESVWWALKTIWDKGLMYKGHKVVPYCPRCGTPLSSHEVAQGYKDVKEDSAYVLFKAKDTENDYFIAWTTTPWTLPSNVALAVNPEESYVKAKAADGDKNYILAEALCGAVLGEGFEIIERFKGRDLERRHYEPLYDFAKPEDDAYYVVCASYVTLTDGTGIVHTAPAFGEDDYRTGTAYNLPFVNLVDGRGCFIDSVNLWPGMFVKDADPKIITELKGRGLLFRKVPYEHSYPFCYRCDDIPLIYYARDAWFIRMTAVKESLLANNNSVNWLPDSVRTGRMGDWLKNVIDWGFSRERYWGTPLPIWECPNGHTHVVGSVAEMVELTREEDKEKARGLELHKPYIDTITLVCPECGQAMKRTPEVIDCWFDSGSMPFAQWHYPFENGDVFNENFPADFISEAIDQTRGWFYTLLAISTLLFDKSPFKNVIVVGHVLDEKGQKMSKSKGNMVEVWDKLNKQGADAVRWYYYTFGAPWLSNRFNEDMLNEGQRKYLGTLWNAYAFFVLYANIDGFNPAEHRLRLAAELPTMDRWVLSRLNTLIKEVDGHVDGYRLTEAARAMADFTDDLSNWYIRRCRERFWAPGMEQDKIDAYMTLYHTLTTMAALTAPFTPFIAESMYRNLVAGLDSAAPESVHLCPFPQSDGSYIDAKLEAGMNGALAVVERGRAARNAAGVKNRQPVGRMYVSAGFELSASYRDIIKEELNVKELEFIDDASRFISYSFKPQLKTLGKRYGKLVPAIGAALASGDGTAFMNELKSGSINLFIEGHDIELAQEDVLIEEARKEGYAVDSDKGIIVVLDINLTPELIEEGFVREIVSKLQNMRKEAGFNVMDKIKVYYEAGDALTSVIKKNGGLIMTEVLAAEITQGSGLEGAFTKEWDLNGFKATLGVALKPNE